MGIPGLGYQHQGCSIVGNLSLQPMSDLCLLLWVFLLSHYLCMSCPTLYKVTAAWGYKVTVTYWRPMAQEVKDFLFHLWIQSNSYLLQTNGPGSKRFPVL